MKKSFIFVSIIFIQLVVIVFLARKITVSKGNVKGITYNPIDIKTIILKLSGHLKYYFEPTANTIEDVNTWVPYKATYTINSDTLNERYDYSEKKSEGAYRIITLGDSFTYGLYVDTLYNWTEKLEDLMLPSDFCKDTSEQEVINLGVYGYDIQYSIERYKTRGIKYNPNLIVWFLKDDDLTQINEIMRKKAEYYKRKMMESGEFDKLVAEGDLYPHWRMATKEMLTKYEENQILAWQKQKILELRNYYKGLILVITLPSTKQKYKDFLNEIAQGDSRMYFMDFLPSIENDPELYFENDGHPTVKGHAAIAQSIYQYLTENKKFFCKAVELTDE